MSRATQELFREDSRLAATTAEVIAVRPEGVVLDRTVFFPTGGGQPGDRGVLVGPTGELQVVDTRYVEGAIVHVLADGATPPAVGSGVEARLDWTRRHRLMRMHSLLHLLCKAVDQPVTGGQIAEDKSRLDFAIAGEVPTKETVTERLQAWIHADLAITHRWIDAAELARRPDLVRTMSVKPPTGGGRIRLVEIDGLDLQACGGTHVARTGEIGAAAVLKIENKGKQNRRFVVALVQDERPS